MTNPYFLDIACGTLTKYNEVLCGDQVAYWKDESRGLIVLADGLGSGVKASVLATLTVNIAMTMLKAGASIHSVFETVVITLPVCRVRGLAYCTLSIIQVDDEGVCTLYEYDNPQAVIIHSGKALQIQREIRHFSKRQVWYSQIRLTVGDRVILFSDGAVHAGASPIFNHDWEWEDLQAYVAREKTASAHLALAHFMMTINQLYAHKALDDVSCAVLNVSMPRHIQVFTGPPEDLDADHGIIRRFFSAQGLKVVCGGTSGTIAARELNRMIRTTDQIPEEGVPPIAYIDGIDLVTEGVITLNRVSALLEVFSKNPMALEGRPQGGATQLCQLLLNHGTHVTFWIGSSENKDHEGEAFSGLITSRRAIVEVLAKQLTTLGKVVAVERL